MYTYFVCDRTYNVMIAKMQAHENVISMLTKMCSPPLHATPRCHPVSLDGTHSLTVVIPKSTYSRKCALHAHEQVFPALVAIRQNGTTISRKRSRTLLRKFNSKNCAYRPPDIHGRDQFHQSERRTMVSATTPIQPPV